MLRFSKINLFYIAVVILLIFVPFVNPSYSMLVLLTQVFVFAVFAMSYDLLLGFTGIVSFGHAMFFGIGAYSTAIFLSHHDPTFITLIVSIIVGAVIAGVVSYIVGMMSLRLKSHYYAMLTLALSQLFLITAEKWRSLTMGNDGITFMVPDFLVSRTTLYFIALFLLVIVFIGLSRFTHSPLGRVLQAIRENETRVRSLGYKVLHYKVIASIVAGVVASLSGAMFMYTLRYVSTSVFAINNTLDVLLMTIIGGVGTLIGPIIGSALIEFAHHYLSNLADVSWIFKRWMILFGLIYILAVMFFPKGIVGTLSYWYDKRLHVKREKKRLKEEQSVKQSTKGA